MKLTHCCLENVLDFGEEHTLSLVMENGNDLYRFVYELLHQIGGRDGEFCLYHRDKELNLETSTDILLSPFDMDVNSKKIQNLILKKLQSYATDDDHICEFQDISKRIDEYAKNLFAEIDLPIVLEPYGQESLIKSITFSVQEDKSFIENLHNYISCVIELSKVQLFVLINFKQYMTDDDFERICKLAWYDDIYILFIDCFESSLITEKTIVVDFDKCEIVRVKK